MSLLSKNLWALGKKQVELVEFAAAARQRPRETFIPRLIRALGLKGQVYSARGCMSESEIAGTSKAGDRERKRGWGGAERSAFQRMRKTRGDGSASALGPINARDAGTSDSRQFRKLHARCAHTAHTGTHALALSLSLFPSQSTGVKRARLPRVGSAESGQVTAIVPQAE